MPHHDHHPHGGALSQRQRQRQPPRPKPSQKVLSLILKVMIMTIITTIFFLFLGVTAMLFLLATAFLHRHHNHQPNSSDGLSFRDLKRLPQFRFSKSVRPEAEIECVVCLEEIRQGQWCRQIVGCGHVFHRGCVDMWLVKVSACPICSTRVRLDAQLDDRHCGDFIREKNGV